ncbi:MAG TPA: 2-hydroxyhepta-2,4-diene-1,7-dioate isomerase [Clostridiales bacterium]|nr:2-hydroxyhepta-2,4-diene-1,7-dioate isomerase [Clostridiales bacterium]
MRYVRFDDQGSASWGILINDDTIQPLSAAPYLGGSAQGRPVSLQSVRLLAPCEPSKIVAVGKNYHDHIQEFDSQVPETPILFLKPTTSLNDPFSPIKLPPQSLTSQVDYEGELALVIGRKACRVSAAESSDYVFGYTCLNDVTARDVQRQDGQWTRAKGMDGFAPVGPLLTDEVDPANLAIRTRLNGKIMQESSTSLLIWPVNELIAFISESMTVLPGDVITTGTPSGVGPMQAGDVVEVSIEGIGVLRNSVE